MRRRTLLTTALTTAGVLAATAACGDGDEGGDAAAAPATGSADTGAFPATVEHAFGSTTIEEEPQRVVTVGFNDQDFVLALGVTPVGVRENLGYDASTRPWAQDLLPAEPLPLVGSTELSVEAIAALSPDLVVGTYAFLTEGLYQQLSGVAPTVGDLEMSPEGGSTATWQEQLAATGTALGKSEEAEALTAEVEGKIAAARDAHPEFAERTISVVLVLDSGYYALDSSDPRGRFFTDLGFTASGTTGEVSAEQVSLLDTDVLVVLGATREEFAANPLAAALPVVTENRTVYVGDFAGDFAGALGFASPLSLPYAVELAVPQLAAASDGDPATVPAEL
ncbi:iron-siderophore ABC transporter substrate-binding protein [Paenibacillus sp. TRM 82003]|uniref:iron-siderophore ABC transporter substrate-binding protein n=1 Tax=Kineococcus sp. TRM81007 TaxID=2925831 RepID=UPI001F5ABCC2|nr:iron-siderophore ABC transporter substrate-binding protein [Kineococcus sp. TRM81007]MCI2237979.1 iron-siderophore ABC transporter substrate-binding protein [Kineococcus sp. TRM81007]MCI3925994.1 iron-siderophore ABC transporter substrate-binding protein [Paenibacillus sp. TRM 82003]